MLESPGLGQGEEERGSFWMFGFFSFYRVAFKGIYKCYHEGLMLGPGKKRKAPFGGFRV